MSNLNVDWVDETLIVMGLGLILSTIDRSGYHPELRKLVVERVEKLIENIQKPKPVQEYDAYGNPY